MMETEATPELPSDSHFDNNTSNSREVTTPGNLPLPYSGMALTSMGSMPVAMSTALASISFMFSSMSATIALTRSPSLDQLPT